MNPSARLGPRLNLILDLIMLAQQQKRYSVIWDCCCDHGYLGIKILQKDLCNRLVFVDQLAHIIEQLTDKLTPYNTGKYSLITADAGDLNLNHLQNNLVIIAGVGVETTIQIINSIEVNHPGLQIDYIICTSTIKKSLREYLSKNKFGLLAENLVCENKRYYEVLYVRGGATGDLSSSSSLSSQPLPGVPLDCNLWDVNNMDHQRFLEKINRPRLSKKPKRKIIRSE